MATQEDLDRMAARLDAVLSGIKGDIEEIKAAHPNLDLSGLEGKVQALEALDAENPAPAPAPEPEPTPEPTPEPSPEPPAEGGGEPAPSE